MPSSAITAPSLAKEISNIVFSTSTLDTPSTPDKTPALFQLCHHIFETLGTCLGHKTTYYFNQSSQFSVICARIHQSSIKNDEKQKLVGACTTGQTWVTARQKEAESCRELKLIVSVALYIFGSYFSMPFVACVGFGSATYTLARGALATYEIACLKNDILGFLAEIKDPSGLSLDTTDSNNSTQRQ